MTTFNPALEREYNNRALEIYNPTNREIDLSLYRICRNSNGGTALVTTPFPAGAKIGPYKTYVAICDKRDTTQYASGNGQEYPTSHLQTPPVRH